MKKNLIIEADSNDGDYLDSRGLVTEEELELMMPVINAIKNFEPYTVEMHGLPWKHDHNYPMGECHRPDLGEKSAEELYGHLPGFKLFEDYVPYGEYGIHTITSITLEPVVESEKLL